MKWKKILEAPYNIFYCGKGSDGLTYISIGCECHPISKWTDENFQKSIIEKHNVKSETIEIYKTYFQTILNEWDLS